MILQPSLDIAQHRTGIIHNKNLLFRLKAKFTDIVINGIHHVIHIQRAGKLLPYDMRTNHRLNFLQFIRASRSKYGNLMLRCPVLHKNQCRLLFNELFIAVNQNRADIRLRFTDLVNISLHTRNKITCLLKLFLQAKHQIPLCLRYNQYFF